MLAEATSSIKRSIPPFRKALTIIESGLIIERDRGGVRKWESTMAVVRPAAGIATRLSLSRYLVYRVSFNCTSQLNNRQKGDVASRTVPTPPNCEAGGGWNKAGGREGCARLRGREINTLWDGGERETYRIVGTALFSFNSYLSLSLSLLSKVIARTGAYREIQLSIDSAGGKILRNVFSSGEN